MAHGLLCRDVNKVSGVKVKAKTMLPRPRLRPKPRLIMQQKVGIKFNGTKYVTFCYLFLFNLLILKEIMVSKQVTAMHGTNINVITQSTTLSCGFVIYVKTRMIKDKAGHHKANATNLALRPRPRTNIPATMSLSGWMLKPYNGQE